METIIALKVCAMLSESPFSLDELVIKTKEVFDQQGIAGFVSLLLELFDAQLCARLVRGTSEWRPRPCCEHPVYESYERVARRIRTSIGTVHLQWRRLRCMHCNRSFIPLREFLDLRLYQSKTSELEKIVTEVVSEQNYRRTTRHLDSVGMIPVPKSTAHRWVTLSDCDRIETQGKTAQQLLTDGTGYKRRPDTDQGIDNQGEVRVVLGVSKVGTVIPFGAWSGKSWEAIGQAILPSGQSTKPIAEVLVSDGEPGLAEGLAHLASEQQRCQWHQVHDLDRFLYWDKAPIEERRRLQSQIAGIIGIELPAADFQVVPAADKTELENNTEKAERQLDELISVLSARGYWRAAGYVRNAKDRLFTYVRLWLRCGLVAYRVTSLIERMMREIGRRLKRIAFGWSETGAAQMTRIIIKRITSAGAWTAYWQDRLRITGKVTLIYKGVSAV
jgi:hypothetical protein